MSAFRTPHGAQSLSPVVLAGLLACLLWLGPAGPARGQDDQVEPQAAPDVEAVPEAETGDAAVLDGEASDAPSGEEAATAAVDPGDGVRRGPSGLKLPRFVSLRAREVNMRTGPGTRYPIDWVYRRRDLPVEVIDEFDTWRRVRDAEGSAGWVHQSMLQGRRTVVVTGEDVSLRRDPQDDSRPVAMLDAGVIAELESCGGEWCVLEVDSLKGWVKRVEVFGVYTDEDVN